VKSLAQKVNTLALEVAHFKDRVRTVELCVGVEGNETCLTKTQVDQILLLQSTKSVSAGINIDTTNIVDPVNVGTTTNTGTLSSDIINSSTTQELSDITTSSTTQTIIGTSTQTIETPSVSEGVSSSSPEVVSTDTSIVTP
jgi:hypothetical protein